MYNLERFVTAQNQTYDGYRTALSEMRRGYKTNHWIWYIFPQLNSLGKSPPAVYYGIASLEEAAAYAAHPVLGPRLREIVQAVLDSDAETARILMGSEIDYLKLQSSMTLFEAADPDWDGYARVLDKYYNGRRDRRTLAKLSR